MTNFLSAVSRRICIADKIRHSPLEKLEDFSLDNGPNHQLEHVEASSDSSIDGSTLSAATSQNGAEFSQSMQLAINHEAPVVETGLLIDLDNNDSPPPSGIISDKKASYHSELNPDFASWNVTLQRAKISRVQLLEDLLEFVETEKSQNETEEVEGFMELSESQQSNRNDSSGAEARAGEFSPSLENASTLRNPYELPSPSRGNLLESPEIDIHLKETSEKEDTSSWHLDEELSDIFQTRTPQLPARLRRKLESADGSPLSSSNVFPSSQCALSLERNPSPGSGNTHYQSGSIPEARRLDLTSSLKDDNSVEDGLDWPQNKSRSKSGSSQKSVSFLEPADERNNDKNGSESMARQTESISDETMPTIGEEWLTSPGDPNGPPTTTNLFSMEGGSLGEEYLISSPKPPVNHTGYIDDAFSIDLESPDSGDVSFAMNRPIEDLLEHISPALSPSKTPQITRVSRVSDRRLPTPDMTPELPIKTRPRTTGVDDTPVIRRDQDRQELLSPKGWLSIRMTSGSLGINGSPGHLYNTDTAEFNLLGKSLHLLLVGWNN
ncbi:hypothetical protein BSL78_06385 [Apostichopus japonicus]|uniref:Uncharacterized protein n=1 Tax=Stichopus japonicus TaxID=307972 RepID=A0A2G8L8Z8_STIJA|nr:hypothetical protein BSL78_06385 [Apostichopus japonicus]